MQYPLNHTQGYFVTEITTWYLLKCLLSSLSVISRGNEHHRLITFCGNSNSSKADDVPVGICLAYYIIANINESWYFSACRGVPEAAACNQQRACMKAGVEELSKEHRASPGLCWEGSIWELALQTRNGL